MRETDIRRGDFAYKGTLITETGEVDIYLAENTGSRIHVTMSATADNPDQLNFAGIHFGLSPSQADCVHIIDENGQFLSEDSVETLALEMIEDSCARLLEYVYGRPAARMTAGDAVLSGDTMLDLTEQDGSVLAKYLEDPEPAGMM